MKTVLVIAMLALAVPAHADTSTVMPVTEGDNLPAPSGSTDAYMAPSKDVPLYVPLTDEQQELPTISASEGEDYVPGIEAPATPPAKKAITDQVPQ